MKAGLFRITFLFLVFSLLAVLTASATHLRAGEITVRRDACNSLKFYITVTVFTNTLDTNVLFGGDDDILDFGDESDPDKDGRPGILIPETPNTARPDLGEGIATATYTIEHTYAAGSEYIINYSEPNRNKGVVNMDGSVDTRFYIETQIIIDPFFGCNRYTPTLAVPPIDRGCTGVAWFHNPGAFDLDGDSLSYELVIPFREKNTTVVNYKDPSDPKFYLNYGSGNEEANDRPSFKINSIDGTITWDAPGSKGEYNIAFVIKEWRNVLGKWYQMGFVRRDMQIQIEECINQRPDLILPEDVCVEAGTILDATIFGTDPDNDDVKIEAFSEIFSLAQAQSPATRSPNPPVYQPTTPTAAELKFQWKTDCDHVKDQPYQVTFKITDKSPTGSKLVTFKTWFIRVVGPPPAWVSATTNLSNRSANLTWENYFCQKAEIMQVWRRVDSLTFKPDSCQTGMPANLGYTLIKELPIKDQNLTPVNSFIDTNNGRGLAAGAVYCYRLVAVFPKPRGGESYVSDEICIPAIIADEPVITNVTIDRTGSTDGQITVKWIEPFEVDPIQFPPPYTYEVYRAEGFSGNNNLTKVPGINQAAKEIIDVGLNTQDKVYNYRIYAKDANGNALDTSSIASSVRLEAQSQLNRIQLTWSADVPWSNQVQGLTHKIYRGDEGATTASQLVLIKEIDVIEGGLMYVDEGQHNNTPLEAGKVYCYVVETLGTYGNENPLVKSKEPFRNFSQIICTEPGELDPPCKPEVPFAHQPMDCSEYTAMTETCNNNIFSNTIKWSRPECADDIAYYKIYISPTSDGVFKELMQGGVAVQVRDTFFIDANLVSFAGCYKILAVDRSGNESELSEAICFDNCPYFELPNVFSPNNDGCNDKFSAYSDRDITGEAGGDAPPTCITPDESKAKCARFVNGVLFKVFNRWGKEVYTYRSESGGERTIYIDWDGRANDGSDLSSGVYFYVAEVNFDSVDPAKQNQTIKGWVQLVR